MPAYTTLTLDTSGPQGVTASIHGGAAYAAVRDVNLAAATTDPDTTGYQMKIWGDVDPAANPSIQANEAASAWIAFNAVTAIRLSNGDGVKSVTIRLRDDVQNASGTASDNITLDTTAPVPTINVDATPAKISKVAGKDTSTLEWSTDAPFEAYEVRVVPSTNSTRNAGAVIGNAAGSTNTSGGAGGYPAATNIVTTIKGADLEAASPGDGAKVIKIFVQDAAGNWSV